MKRYIQASITSEVNDIVNNMKDVKSRECYEPFWDEDAVKWYLGKNTYITDYEIVKITPDSPDYQKYHGGLNLEYYPKPYFVLKWIETDTYNATRVEELNALFKTIKTFDELQEFYDAINSIGDGTWFYTKRNNNPLNSAFWEVPNEPEYAEYIVDRHSAVLKCKISNLYKVLKIY